MKMTNTDSFEGERVLVTGASGFIGGRLCIKLKEMGAEIYGVSREKQKQSDIIDQWFRGDLVNFDFTKSTIKRVKPDIIFHLAGFVSGRRDRQVVRKIYHNNLTITVNVLMAATEVGIQRLTLAGSMEEPDPDSDKLTPVSPYAASKWACTVHARMFYKLYDTPVTIPRIFMVYGPGKQNLERLIPYVILSLINQKKPELTSGTRLVDWIYIDDVVEGLISLAHAEGVEGKTIELGAGKQFTIREICNKIVSVMESNIQLEFGEKPDRPFERVRVANLEMAKRYLEWEPAVDIDKGLKKTVEWFKTNES